MDQPAPAGAPSGPQGPGFQSAAGAGGSPQGGGQLPPSTAPMPQDNPPLGENLKARHYAAMGMAFLHLARMSTDPLGEEYHAYDKAFKGLEKFIQPDMQTVKNPPPISQPGQGMRPPSGGQGAMPAQPPRGPIPMQAQGNMPG